MVIIGFLNLDFCDLMKISAKQFDALDIVGTIKLFVDGMGTLKRKEKKRRQLVNGTHAKLMDN
jgi:hypothetical protein